MAACALLIGSAAVAATKTSAAKSGGKQRFSIDAPVTSFQPPVSDFNKFSFTAAGNTAASARLQTQERAFRFTPAGQPENRKALSLGLSTRVVAAAADKSRAPTTVEASAALPTAFGVDVSVGWKGFAVNTGYRHVEPGPGALLANRSDAVDVGLSYGGQNWKTRLQGTAEQATGDAGSLLLAPLARRFSVELGGAYNVAPRLSVSGGVRYTLAPNTPTPLDADRADQSVYLGTNIAF
jgi:predicted porin